MVSYYKSLGESELLQTDFFVILFHMDLFHDFGRWALWPTGLIDFSEGRWLVGSIKVVLVIGLGSVMYCIRGDIDPLAL